MICISYGPADATAAPSSLASLISRMALPLWYRLTEVVVEKRPFNGCSCYFARWRDAKYCD